MTGMILVSALIVVQLVYLVAVLITFWFFTQRVDLVDRRAALPATLPDIVLFYPVLNELEGTMRTTFTGLAKAEYPGRVRVISIPNANDAETIASLQRLQHEFAFLEVMPVPPTTDSSWNTVWSHWDTNPNAYWWHHDKRAGSRDLPPKKTRQLIWAMYQVAPGNEHALLSYIDADSIVPEDYWRTAAIGMQSYDVIQNTNITGNLLATWPASFYANDHISWDSTLYKHMTARGRQPFYVLGKGLFFRFRDLIELGGFHPWLTIEDPEVGMRMWTNGRRLGVVESPLIEEVPATWSQGVTQRKRWVAGFYQSLGRPLTRMGMTPAQRFRARLNFVPCLSLGFNPIGFAVGIWAVVAVVITQGTALPLQVNVLATTTMTLAVLLMIVAMVRAWQASKDVLPRRRDRLRFVARVNPLFVLVYWLWWSIPLAKGLVMYVRDTGLVWERTEKINSNQPLVDQRESAQAEPTVQAVPELVPVEVPARSRRAAVRAR